MEANKTYWNGTCGGGDERYDNILSPLLVQKEHYLLASDDLLTAIRAAIRLEHSVLKVVAIKE